MNEDGLTCQTILEAVPEHQADLRRLGVHGVHRGIEHLLIGLNTEKIMLSATCPILTVGAHVLTGFDIKLHVKELLLFSDFSADSASAAPYALKLGKEFGLPVDVCQLLPIVAERNTRLMDLLNSRMAYVSIWRGQFDTDIYRQPGEVAKGIRT